MAAKDPTKVARENVDAYNAGDWKRLKAVLGSGSVYHEIGTQRRIRGADRILQAYQAWKQALPDSKGTVTNSFARGNSVVLEITWKGTHTGTLEGPAGSIPPSYKRFSVPAAQVVSVAGGKIKQVRHYFDFLTLLQQIGAAPQPSSGGETPAAPARRQI